MWQAKKFLRQSFHSQGARTVNSWSTLVFKCEVGTVSKFLPDDLRQQFRYKAMKGFKSNKQSVVK